MTISSKNKNIYFSLLPFVFFISLFSNFSGAKSGSSFPDEQDWKPVEIDRIDTKLGGVSIDGEIMPGDYKKVKKLMVSQSLDSIVMINSPGGNLYETIKIGRFVRKNLIDVKIMGQCDSACALIAIAEAAPISLNPFINYRDSSLHSTEGSDLGFHRPKFQSKYYSSKSLDEIRETTSELEKHVVNYVKDMGMSDRIFDKMMSTPSDSIWHISQGEYYREVGFEDAIEEWIIGNCGRLSAEEMSDLKIALQEEYGSATGSSDKRLSSGYKKYLKEKIDEISSCTRELIKKERKKRLQSYK